jgi:hypothetical protein
MSFLIENFAHRWRVGVYFLLVADSEGWNGDDEAAYASCACPASGVLCESASIPKTPLHDRHRTQAPIVPSGMI